MLTLTFTPLYYPSSMHVTTCLWVSQRQEEVEDGDAVSDGRRRFGDRFPFALALWLGVPLLCVVAYATLQRGPIRALDCWIADDFFVDVGEPGMTLGDFRAEVKNDTRNCISVQVVNGPTSDDSIVVLPSPSKWMFYRGDYTLEISTTPPE